MIAVLDVSAAVELVMGRPGKEVVAGVLKEADWVVAPSLFSYEAANVMWKYHKVLPVSAAEIVQRVKLAIDLVDEFLPAEDIFEEALSLACQIKHPAYDAVYLVTSRRKKATLLSLDQRLLDAAKKLKIPVHG
jgi:predicted nucleic acid-binding protein